MYLSLSLSFSHLISYTLILYEFSTGNFTLERWPISKEANIIETVSDRLIWSDVVVAVGCIEFRGNNFFLSNFSRRMTDTSQLTSNPGLQCIYCIYHLWTHVTFFFSSRCCYLISFSYSFELVCTLFVWSNCSFVCFVCEPFICFFCIRFHSTLNLHLIQTTAITTKIFSEKLLPLSFFVRQLCFVFDAHF